MKITQEKAKKVKFVSKQWADMEEMEWQQGRGSEESGSEGDGEKKHVEWERGDRHEEMRENWERGGGDWVNYDHSLGQMLHEKPEDLSVPLR